MLFSREGKTHCRALESSSFSASLFFTTLPSTHSCCWFASSSAARSRSISLRASASRSFSEAAVFRLETGLPLDASSSFGSCAINRCDHSSQCQRRRLSKVPISLPRWQDNQWLLVSPKKHMDSESTKEPGRQIMKLAILVEPLLDPASLMLLPTLRFGRAVKALPGARPRMMLKLCGRSNAHRNGWGRKLLCRGGQDKAGAL